MQVMNDLLWLGAMEHIATRNKDIGTSLNKAGSSVMVYTTVNLDKCLGAALAYQLA